MKQFFLGILVLTVLSTTLSLVSCTCSKKEDRDIAKPVPVMEAAGLLQNGFAVLVDVRDLATAKKGTPTNAVHIPEKDLEKQLPAAVGSKQVIVCCDSVACGQRISADLARKGYKASFIPSFSEWKQEGLPIRSNW